MGSPPLLLLLVLSPALASPFLGGPNLQPVKGQYSASLGDQTLGRRLRNNTVLCESNGGDWGVCMPAGACVGQGGQLEGTCGGVVAGANRATPTFGYQCCVFKGSCGSTVTESVVHFQSPDFPTSGAEALACNLQLRVRPGVCQLRIDFLDLIMPGPGTDGACTNINNFKIMAPGAPLGLIGSGTDSVCGENTGNHLYVPVSAGDSVQLLATLSGIGAVPLTTVVGTLASDIEYKWNVRITQVECNSNDPRMNELEAPSNCLQYFTASFGKFKSFNFDRVGIFAPNQDYAACFADMSNGLQTCSVTLRADYFGLPVNTAASINKPVTGAPRRAIVGLASRTSSIPTPAAVNFPDFENPDCQTGTIIVDACPVPALPCSAACTTPAVPNGCRTTCTVAAGRAVRPDCCLLCTAANTPPGCDAVCTPAASVSPPLPGGCIACTTPGVLGTPPSCTLECTPCGAGTSDCGVACCTPPILPAPAAQPCCSHPISSHLSFSVDPSGTPGAPTTVDNALRSLFCGSALGPLGEITGAFGRGPFIVRVWGGDHTSPLATINTAMTGFEINYKLNTGLC